MASRRVLIAAITLMLGMSSVNAAQHFSHTKLAAITYSGSTQTQANGNQLGRHYDLLINPSAALANWAIAANPGIRIIDYSTLSTIRGSDTTNMATWLGFTSPNSNAAQRAVDTLLIRSNGTQTLSVRPPQPIGVPCVAGNCTNTIGANQRLTYCHWTSWRNVSDWGKDAAWNFLIYNALYLTNNSIPLANKYGIMEDEALSVYVSGNYNYQNTTYPGRINAWSAIPSFPLEDFWCSGNWTGCVGWESYTTHALVRQRMLDIWDIQMPRVVDSMNAHGRKIFSNQAAGGRDSSQNIDDVRRFGRSIMYGEGMLISLQGTNFGENGYKLTAWIFMDSLAVWGPLKGGEALIATYINRNDSLYLPAGGRYQRAMFHNYCWYMMASNPYTYLYVHNNDPNAGVGGANDYWTTDSIYKWQNIFAVDVGPPTSTRYIAVNGTYPVWRRDFQKGSILYRPGAPAVDMSDASAVSVPLGQPMYRATRDTSSWGAASTTTQLRVGDGAVLVTPAYFNSTPTTGSIGVSDASTTEGNNAVFTFTLSQAQATGGNVRIDYSTANGTATSPTHYPATSGTVNIPAGSLTATVSVGPTVNDGVGGVPPLNSRYFYLNYTITNTAPANVYIADPQGIAYINDAGTPSVTNTGIKTKSRIRVKGRVIKKP